MESVASLGQFKQLRRLSLTDNRITNLTGLGDLPRIEHLYLIENRICDLRPIQRLTSLKELRLQRNQFISLKPLSGFHNVEVLSLSNNFIYSISPIVNLKGLKRLSISGNCLDLEGPTNQEQFGQIRSQGVFLNTGNQKKRIIELESLVYSLIGHPVSNTKLGGYLEKNCYLRLIDFNEDPSLDEDDKKNAYQNWTKALINGTSIDETAFPGT